MTKKWRKLPKEERPSLGMFRLDYFAGWADMPVDAAAELALLKAGAEDAAKKAEAPEENDEPDENDAEENAGIDAPKPKVGAAAKKKANPKAAAGPAGGKRAEPPPNKKAVGPPRKRMRKAETDK